VGNDGLNVRIAPRRAGGDTRRFPQAHQRACQFKGGLSAAVLPPPQLCTPLFARHLHRRFPTQNRAPGLFEGRKFWHFAREGRFDIRQLVYSSSDHWRSTLRNGLLESARSTRSVSGSTTQQRRRRARANVLVSRFLTVIPENQEITALDQSHQDCRS